MVKSRANSLAVTKDVLETQFCALVAEYIDIGIKYGFEIASKNKAFMTNYCHLSELAESIKFIASVEEVSKYEKMLESEKEIFLKMEKSL